MKRHFIGFLLCVMSCMPLGMYAMEPANFYSPFVTISDEDRGYGIVDDIPFNIGYIPSLFSVRYQMARYGVAQEDGDGFTFAQPSQQVFHELEQMIEQLGYTSDDFYILKLNPAMSARSTTFIVTHRCLFVDEAEWVALNNLPLIKQLAQEYNLRHQDVAFWLRRYVLRRALAHFERDSYRRKQVSKIVIGAAISFVVYKAVQAATNCISEHDAALGFSDSLCQAPGVNSVCSTTFVPYFDIDGYSILKFVGATVLSDIIASGVKGVIHPLTTQPIWRFIDRQAEQDALQGKSNSTKKIIRDYYAKWRDFYAEQQADSDQPRNAILADEYNRRYEHLDSIVKQLQ